ncbi:MAG: hypothetical protein ONB48_03530 [candidate division KSB1 bacterium]|nr:hypothetical protein [candidate division KSB1 bacterium]MDZ7275589.1 hypothetical protein [candidate division KSB1 bacterium]MDZ7284720.1 hypothetical protein [candidate division KSB1 bacterium]MDZ7297861.1 hypothetical protein [candidate division KSB1 bacterium]MDZ7309558.1 hypothetical protein [candidate division KSB1 bacterium]
MNLPQTVLRADRAHYRGSMRPRDPLKHGSLTRELRAKFIRLIERSCQRPHIGVAQYFCHCSEQGIYGNLCDPFAATAGLDQRLGSWNVKAGNSILDYCRVFKVES